MPDDLLKLPPLPGGAARRGIDLDASEHWLIRRGTPTLIEDYNAAEDVFTRAAPALTLVFLVSMFGAGNLRWTFWQNAAAVCGGIALLIGIWAFSNRVRHRPLFQPPEDVEWPELLVFVLGPTLVQLVFGGQVRAAAWTAVALVSLLVVLYLVTSYGLVPLSRWALVQMVQEVQAVLGLFLRALPLLLLVVTFLFINAEVWEIAGNLNGPFYAMVSAMFAGLAIIFLTARLPSELERLASFDDTTEIEALVAGTPAEFARTATIQKASTTTLPFTRRQRHNLLLVALVSQGLQIVLVGLLISGFFVTLGLLAVSPATLVNWVGHEGSVLVEFTVFDRSLELTRELLKVAGFLGAFSSLHFTVTLITDDTYRSEFFDTVMEEIRQTLAVRAVYATRFRRAADPPPDR